MCISLVEMMVIVVKGTYNTTLANNNFGFLYEALFVNHNVCWLSLRWVWTTLVKVDIRTNVHEFDIVIVFVFLENLFGSIWRRISQL